MKKNSNCQNVEQPKLVNRGGHEIIVERKGSFTTFFETLETREKKYARLSLAQQAIGQED